MTFRMTACHQNAQDRMGATLLVFIVHQISGMGLLLHFAFGATRVGASLLGSAFPICWMPHFSDINLNFLLRAFVFEILGIFASLSFVYALPCAAPVHGWAAPLGQRFRDVTWCRVGMEDAISPTRVLEKTGATGAAHFILFGFGIF